MKWNFPSNNDGDINGISNPGIEMFQGTPLKSLAREICQNSLDATIDNEVTKIQFKLFAIESDTLPDFDKLKKVFELSKQFWSRQESNKAKDFYERAIHASSQDKIQVLRISDYNTRGLEGSNGDYNTPWLNLTKSSGTSDKSGSNGGSFGIGKYAPFACSDFRTVFYNTLDIAGYEAFQGISRLASFENEYNKVTTGVGYIGADHNRPLNQLYSLEKDFSRDTTGTDVYILGFKYQDWKSDVILSVLEGFLYAIYNGNLEVDINGEVTINESTLPEIINDYGDYSKEYLLDYYNVLTSNDTVWVTSEFKNKGKIHLGLIIKENLKKRIAMVRKTGMKIKDEGNLSSFIPFAGVLYIEGEEINNYLRNLENPEHTKWQPDRDVGHESEAREFLRSLRLFLKEHLDKLNNSENNESFDPNIGDLLPMDTDDEGKGKKKVDIIADKIINIEEKKRKVGKPKILYNYNQDANDKLENLDSDDTGEIVSGYEHKNQDSKSKANDNNKSDSAEENGEEKETTIISVDSSKIRVLCINKSLGEYAITFVPVIDAKKGKIELYQVAETDMYKVKIKSVMGFGNNNNICCYGNEIKDISFIKDEPVRLKVILDTDDYLALEVKAYGNQI